ncbi:uncharacterized protein HD556DRAFT_1494772 [Suillus plorans]|uniref:Uncharacterized protein n=1 Tax=Suillus plorans TaxID=116603 RepID=A0A9P7DT62_9AGAM|nr:uncharacterized protein HD556DRAFT_1494772 [Suillus plorans]KAG1802316.1 hypothetical protein HD556DRAFT_1494772 [Suillus plorans]
MEVIKKLKQDEIETRFSVELGRRKAQAQFQKPRPEPAASAFHNVKPGQSRHQAAYVGNTCLQEMCIFLMDFSWGETRKVAGEAKREGHGAGSGTFDGSLVPLRRWEDWERSRLCKLKREERRRHDFDRMHPAGYISSQNDLLSVRNDTRSQYGDRSDTHSVVSSEDDHYGPQIGGYNENNTQFPAPPVGLFASGNKVVGGAELEAMSESGFDDDESPRQRTPTSAMYAARYQLSDNPSQQHLMSYASSDSGSRTPPVQYQPYGTQIEDRSRTGDVKRAPSVTNSVLYGPPDLHNIPYETGQRIMGPCCVYSR